MFSEKLYALRKQNGLSQDQLAEQLHVSRQSISKWESGISMPESEKLIAISNYFQVSLDELLKDGEEASKPCSAQERTPKGKPLVGLILCVSGIACLLFLGILMLCSPHVSQQMSEASVIRIDGNGILMLLSVAAVIVGAVLLLKDRNH